MTGATGFVGSAVARTLVSAGHDVIGLTTQANKMPALAANGVEPALGDMRDAAAWRMQVSRCDAIVHAGQLGHGIRITRGVARSIADADLEAVRVLIDNAPERCSAFIYTCGAWIYGDCTGGSQQGGQLKPYPIAGYRLEAARLLMEAAESARKLPAMILRLGSVYGNGGLFKKLNLDPLVRGSRIYYPGDGTQKVSFIHADDVGRAYHCCLTRPVPGKIFDVCDDEPVSCGAFARELARQFGGKQPGSIPAWLVRLVAGPLVAGPIMGSTVIRNDKLAQACDFKPKFGTYREGIASLAKLYGRGGNATTK
ncbi:NAD-dependent epimerase/dehydratase family protein [Bradyrhizobium liaoningense]